MAESLMRIEVTKTGKFNVFDKLDMLEVLAENQIDVSNCFGKKCLTSVGRQSGVDKMITGAIENLGKKIVITVKVLDVKQVIMIKLPLRNLLIWIRKFRP